MSPSDPFVSVVIPVYNDPHGIELTLESVTGQTYPAEDYEILAVDNNSTDGTRDVIQRYADRYRNVSLVGENQIQGPAAARNKGIEHGKGSIFTFIDTDMTVEPDWLESIIEAFIDGGHDYMGCPVKIYPPPGRRTIASEYDRLFAFPMEDYVRNSKYAGTGCLTVRKEVFNTVGLFDSHLISGEDKEFGRRVYEVGFDLYFEPTVTMYHPARSSAVEQLKKSFRIGRGEQQLRKRYPDRFGPEYSFRLRDYLPLKPWSFLSEFGCMNDFSIREMVWLYLLISSKSIVNSLGQLYERFECDQ